MNRADVMELHYVTAIANLPSIMEHGILSYTLADQLAHDSVAMPEIQERRRNKQIPGAGLLHQYANLYFDAHNPMLSRCRGRNNEICVLQINPSVLDIRGVIIANRMQLVTGPVSGLCLVGSL
jgi:ssDNA thymidine ADP-ribosyltransferase, DarT